MIPLISNTITISNTISCYNSIENSVKSRHVDDSDAVGLEEDSNNNSAFAMAAGKVEVCFDRKLSQYS